MSLSLREQLLKAGLVTEKQVQQAEREQRQQRFQAPRGKKQEKLERRAKYAEIKQLVAAHQIPRVETEDFYNFQDGTQIRRIEVTPELRTKLIDGEIAIVRCEGRFAFVPAAIGEQIGERVPKALLHLNRPQEAPAEDDPYKDFVVPDDLMW